MSNQRNLFFFFNAELRCCFRNFRLKHRDMPQQSSLCRIAWHNGCAQLLQFPEVMQKDTADQQIPIQDRVLTGHENSQSQHSQYMCCQSADKIVVILGRGRIFIKIFLVFLVNRIYQKLQCFIFYAAENFLYLVFQIIFRNRRGLSKIPCIHIFLHDFDLLHTHLQLMIMIQDITSRIHDHARFILIQ